MLCPVREMKQPTFFVCSFLDFGPRFQTFATNLLESVIGSAPVEHPIGRYCMTPQSLLPGAKGSLPKDLSSIQFMIRFLGYIQEEHSNTVRNNMIAYRRHLL